MSMVRADIIPENELVGLLQAQDQRGIEAVYRQYGDVLLGSIYQVVGDQAVAEDVLQECLVRIWKKAGQYDAGKGRLFTWMINICRNASIDKLRSKEFRHKGEIRDGEDLVSRYDREFFETPNPDTIGLRDMVKKLKQDHRDLIYLVYLQGYTHTEASEELAIPLGTVKTRLRIAMRELREMMKS